MTPLMLGAYGLVGWGVYRLLFKKSPYSTQATPVIPPIIKPPTPTPTTSTTANVAAVQSRLNVLGANPQLAVDGISGPKTLAAIKAFQAANGIEPDGIVGPITQAALNAGGKVPTTPTPTPVQPAVNYLQQIAPTSLSDNTIHTTQETWAEEPEQSLVDHF
jgi:peptidoglycan hydrolase-like protein with peptidoglycan-binding domain